MNDLLDIRRGVQSLRTEPRNENHRPLMPIYEDNASHPFEYQRIQH